MSFRNRRLALTLAIAAACFGGPVAHAAIFPGEQCSAFIQTSHPGVDATVPYGAVYGSLGEAREDALNRCSLTNVAQEGWGQLCQTWCVPVDR